MPNMTMVWAILAASKWATYFWMGTTRRCPADPWPTTVKPMTDPEEKATFRPLFRALAGGLRGAGVGGGGDAHTHKAGQGGVDAAGQEGEGDEPVVQHPEIGQSQQDDEDHHEHLSHSGVLVTQIGVSALTDGGSDLLHGVVAFGEGQDFLPLQDGKQQGCHRTDKSDPEIIVQNLHSPLLLTSFDSCLR